MQFDPPWLVVAYDELGVAEIPGRDHNARIVEYHSVTAGGESPDETPWCSSAACWCLEQIGLPHTRSKAAISFETYGVPCGLILGAIVVMKFKLLPTKQRHVGFLAGVTKDGKIVLTGGNQGNAFSLKAYPKRFVTAARWPAPPIVDDPGTAGTR